MSCSAGDGLRLWRVAFDLGVSDAIVSSSPISLRGAPCSYPTNAEYWLDGARGFARIGILTVVATPISAEASVGLDDVGSIKSAWRNVGEDAIAARSGEGLEE